MSDTVGDIAKSLIKPLVPETLLRLRTRLRRKRIERRYRGRSVKEVFSSVYERHEWGGKETSDFFSGYGSHDPRVTLPYVEAVRDFLKRLDKKPVAVDLGCGDFNVGKQVCSLCDKYVACDIVPELIERNRRHFTEPNVSFEILDIVEDPLPEGQVVFLRQVLQHLSNTQISSVVKKLSIAKFKFLFLTEALPLSAPFKANLDKPTGPHTRILVGSGVVLPEPPFNLECADDRLVLQIDDQMGGLISTRLYRLL